MTPILDVKETCVQKTINILDPIVNMIGGHVMTIYQAYKSFTLSVAHIVREVSETTLNYWTMVERYPNLKEEVGSSISNCEISSLLDRNLPGGQLPPLLCGWPVGLLSPKNKNKKSRRSGLVRKSDHLRPIYLKLMAS